MTLITDFIRHYTSALLCFGRDEEDEPVELDADDLSEDSRIEIERDCRLFMGQNAALLEQAVEVYGLDAAAHDFYLTRCGHGAGYWDGDLPRALGEQLTQACKAFHGTSVYRGDDGLLYVYEPPAPESKIADGVSTLRRGAGRLT